jgi:hypothetical protein
MPGQQLVQLGGRMIGDAAQDIGVSRVASLIFEGPAVDADKTAG